TFFIVVLGWILFRSANVEQAMQFFEKMFSFSFHPYAVTTHVLVVFVAAAIFSFIPLKSDFSIGGFSNQSSVLSLRKALLSVLAVILVMMICVVELASGDFNPFIYFKF